MSEQDTSNETLRATLLELQAQWLAQAQEAEMQGRQISVNNIQQALYKRGIAEGLQKAVADVQQLLANREVLTEQTSETTYVLVTREATLALLGQVGLHITELHQHQDHTFSAILPPLQALSFEERLDKLRTIANIVILATGRLPNSNKAYVDFAFSTPYTP
jgi:hypothetical protein